MAKAKKLTTEEIKAILLEEGLNPSYVEIALSIHDDLEKARDLAIGLGAADKAKKVKAEQVKAEKEERSKESQAALMRICGTNVPECYNSVRDEKRFSAPRKNQKISEGREVVRAEKDIPAKGIKIGDIVKVHDRDLFGIRFTNSEGFNFTLQAELPFERRGKLDLSDSEHAKKKDEMLKTMHASLMGMMTEKGEFLSV